MIEGIEFPEPSKAKPREHLVAPPVETMASTSVGRMLQLIKAAGVEIKA
ncbi:MAG: hypothetical protein Q8O52_13410 [Sulfuritalea sp.]|nr:hypothetical protein [Sulfuritalea sp.]